MTPKPPRLTSNAPARLAALLAAVWLAACAPPPPASTRVPPTVAPTQTAAPVTTTAAPTDTAEPPTATASPVPATSTPRPTRTRAASATPAATDTVAAATAAATTAVASPVPAGDFSPTQPQVWNTTVVGGDNQTGSCSATANAPYGLILLTPGEGTLALHNTVPEDYVLSQLAPNTYQYAGPAYLGDGNITLDIVFTSATTLEMTRTFAPSAEPGCTHQHRYTGQFRNNR